MAQAYKGCMVSVLFVCTGNICRSPTAEGVFRDAVTRAGLADSFSVIDSAGIDAWHIGDPPDPRAIAEAKRHDIDLSSLRARQVQSDDFSDFRYIIAMDGGHYSKLENLRPHGISGDGLAKLWMFLDDGDVPDPWYGDETDFRDVFNLIGRGTDQLLTKIRNENGL